MKNCRIVLMIIFLCMGVGMSVNVAPGQSPQEITPTEVYYLAQAIERSLVRMYNLPDEPFLKKRISENLRPRNVYQKALFVVEEFGELHPGAIDRERIALAQRAEASQTLPGDVYRLLSVMSDYLAARGRFVESDELREPKRPSDVYHKLRQITGRHIQIAAQKGMVTDWAAVPRVYDAVVNNLLPTAQAIAVDAGIVFQDYPFPRQPVSDVTPYNIYKLISHIYGNIARYYRQKDAYEAIELIEINDCDVIAPVDVFDLIQVVSAELKAEIGIKPLAATTAEAYRTWREKQETIVPGHTFRLGQYLYLLTKSVLETIK